MFPLDIVTILVLYKSSLIAGVLAFMHMRRQSRGQSGLGILIIGFALLILGSTLAGWGSAGLLPLNVWTLTSLIVGTLGYGMIYLGIYALSRQRAARQGWLILVPPALFTLAALITGFHTDDRTRSCLFHLQAAGFLAAAAWPVWRDRGPDPLPSRLPLALVLAGCALVYVLVAWAIMEQVDYVDWIAHGFAFQILGNFGIAVLVCGFATDRAERDLRRAAEMDSLTGIGNRRWLEARLPSTLRAGDALIVLDLDHFKQVNDRHGHAAGDATLVATACTLREALRTQDLPARMGGEEFLLFLPGLGAQARVIAEGLRRRIEQQLVRHQDSTISVTASLGVAVAERDNVGWEPLYHAADSALYDAKRRGRNRVVDHAELITPVVAALPASAVPGLHTGPVPPVPVPAVQPGP